MVVSLAPVPDLPTSAIEVQIAGQVITNPFAVVAGYCRQLAGTLERYDRLAGTSTSLTPELVRATRRVSSRISNREVQWFADRAQSAPWHAVPAEADLRDADPLVRGGLYDAAEQLYWHFGHHRLVGVGRGKISKCLYLMRPHLFPVLDSRLVALYRRAAAAAALSLVSSRPDLPRVRRAYWAAIRLDLLRAADALARLRAAMRATADASLIEAAELLSDLRLLDILAWKTSGSPAAEN